MTTSAVVYTFLFVHIGVIVVATAYFAVGSALAPAMTERGRIRFARRPWLPTLIGVIVSVPWIVVALILLNLEAGPLKFAGATLGCLWLLAGLFGGASIAQHIGRARSVAPASWMDTVRGGLFISLTWILPLVGWLVMLPLTLAAGIGCLLMGLLPVAVNTDIERARAGLPVA